MTTLILTAEKNELKIIYELVKKLKIKHKLINEKNKFELNDTTLKAIEEIENGKFIVTKNLLDFKNILNS